MKIIRDQSELVLWLADIISEQPSFFPVNSFFHDEYMEMISLLADTGAYGLENPTWDAVLINWVAGTTRLEATQMSGAALAMLVNLTAMNIKVDAPVPVQFYVIRAFDLIDAEEDVILTLRDGGLWVESTAAFERRFQTKLRVLCTGWRVS